MMRISVIPAATKSMPKEMYPIVDKPTIQFIVEEAVAAGYISFGILFVAGRTLVPSPAAGITAFVILIIFLLSY